MGCVCLRIQRIRRPEWHSSSGHPNRPAFPQDDFHTEGSILDGSCGRFRRQPDSPQWGSGSKAPAFVSPLQGLGFVGARNPGLRRVAPYPGLVYFAPLGLGRLVGARNPGRRLFAPCPGLVCFAPLGLWSLMGARNPGRRRAALCPRQSSVASLGLWSSWGGSWWRGGAGADDLADPSDRTDPTDLFDPQPHAPCSHGLTSEMPVALKSAVLRVARVRPWTLAVAAM